MGTLPPADALEPRSGDLEGPVSLGVAFERPAPEGGEAAEGARTHEGRVVVIGSADWLQSMPMRDPRFVNLDLALALTGWLTERETLISIAPKQIDAEPMMITEEDLGALAIRLLGLMPGAMLLLGFAMWWSRRS